MLLVLMKTFDASFYRWVESGDMIKLKLAIPSTSIGFTLRPYSIANNGYSASQTGNSLSVKE